MSWYNTLDGILGKIEGGSIGLSFPLTWACKTFSGICISLTAVPGLFGKLLLGIEFIQRFHSSSFKGGL